MPGNFKRSAPDDCAFAIHWLLVLFLSCALVAAYVVLLYPLLAVWRASRSSNTVRKTYQTRPVSVIIPVHNGGAFLQAKLESILALDYPREAMEILVVDDGSTDETAAIAASFRTMGVRVLQQPKSGKPAALNLAIPQAKGDLLLLTDVRQHLEKGSLRELVACFADPRVGVVSGDLIIREGDGEENTVGLYWRYERWIRKQLSRIDSIFGATGPFYMMRRELAVPIPPEVLLDDMYLPLAAFFRGYRLIVDESAIAYDYPTTIETEFGRKVRTLAGNYQLFRYYPQLFTTSNRMLFHFLSLKVGRLLTPWLAAGMIISSFLLPQPWAMLAQVGEVALFGLALLDSFVPTTSLLKRATSPARTVLSMLWAAVLGLQVFFVAPQKLWKPTRVRLEHHR